MAVQPPLPYQAELDTDSLVRVRAAKSHTSALQTVGYEMWPVGYTRGQQFRTVSKSFIVGCNCNELVRRADVEALIENMLKGKQNG